MCFHLVTLSWPNNNANHRGTALIHETSLAILDHIFTGVSIKVKLDIALMVNVLLITVWYSMSPNHLILIVHFISLILCIFLFSVTPWHLNCNYIKILIIKAGPLVQQLSLLNVSVFSRNNFLRWNCEYKFSIRPRFIIYVSQTLTYTETAIYAASG